jgi:hypothetical protein
MLVNLEQKHIIDEIDEAEDEIARNFEALPSLSVNNPVSDEVEVLLN